MQLAHCVYFTLKDKSPAAADALVAACMKYLTVQPGIAYFAAGKLCRELDRPVNDLDYDVSLHLTFTDKAAHDAYQTDATHQRFIDENKTGWDRVRVFDSYVASK
jgi:hypothetical protein